MEIKAFERSHSYWVDCRDLEVKKLIKGFLVSVTSTKTTITRGVTTVEYDQTYAARSPCGNFVGLLKPSYQRFIEEVRFKLGYSPNQTILRDLPSSGTSINFDIKPDVKFKDEEQEEAYNFTMTDRPMHILECATGFGKTFLGIYSSAKIGERTLFLMQSGHIGTWLDDIEKFINIKKTDVGIIRGRDSLVAAYDLLKIGKYEPKFIFASSETFREYIKAYETDNEYVDLKPGQFCKAFNIGRVVRDEAHEALHTLVKQSLYLNVKSMLCLSATIVSEDKFIIKMQETMFPKEHRWKSKNNNHIEAFSVRYYQDYTLKLRYSTGYGYSQMRYEKSILKRPCVRKQYMDMIMEVVDNFKIDYQKGMKMMVFCGLVEMCEYVTKILSGFFPDLKVATYVGKTDRAVLKEADVIITTLGSCGTGTNIVDLAHAYNTVSVGSRRQAWQAMGRLRKLVNYPGVYPKYYFFSNMSIAPHRKFESKRQFDLLDKTKSLKTIDLGMKLKRC